MNNAAVIEATFCGFRTVGGRKQLQLTFEVPIEKSAHVLQALGSPDAVDPSWVAIALLDKELMKAQGAQAPVLPKSTPPLVNTREKRNWNSLTEQEQAGIRCAEPAFWKFLEEEKGYEISGKESVVSAVRAFCGVKSRAEFSENALAAGRWATLDNHYQLWMRAG